MFSYLTLHHKILAAFTIAYIVLFGGHYVRALNYEFLGYLVVLLVGFGLILGTIRKTEFPLYVLWGLSVWGLLHMAGGSVPAGDTVLYGYRILPIFDGGGEFFILKMDQVIHAFGFGVTALLMLHLLRRAGFAGTHETLAGITAAMAAMGFGAVNEIVEFGAVLAVPGNGVGGYFNTALDIVFNAIGAVGAVLGFYVVRKLKRGA